MKDFLTIPVDPKDEVDLEGLDFDGQYLWLVGSHSLKRKKSDKSKPDSQQQRLANPGKIIRKGNRFLLARIPVKTDTGLPSLVKPGDDIRVPAQLPGDAIRNELIDILRDGVMQKNRSVLITPQSPQPDDHLAAFLDIPSKDNGFDIEGRAVKVDKVFLGLHAPVLRGWAFILELTIREEADANDVKVLKIQDIEKHVVHLGGLGIRDLSILNNDLFILAGPTMDLDGPVKIFRWIDGVKKGNQGEVLVKVRDIHFGEGDDHAEGICLISTHPSGAKDSILVVYDSSSGSCKIGSSTAKVDIFPLF